MQARKRTGKQTQKSGDDGRNKILNMAVMGLMTAFMCVISPFSIQLPGQVPISLSLAVIYLTVYLLGGLRGTACCALYLLIGLVGLPVFSGFGSGVGKLAGPTGGYLAGYVLTAALCGIFLRMGKGKIWVYIIGMIVGGGASYFLGTLWFMFSMQASLNYTLAACVYPFIPFEAAKIAAVAVLGPVLKNLLCKAGNMENVIVYARPANSQKRFMH